VAKRKAPNYNRDWDRLRIEWARSGKKLSRWAKLMGIPYVTAKRNIEVLKKQEYLDQASPQLAKFQTKIAALTEKLADDERPVHLRACLEIANDLLIESASAFFDTIGNRQYLRPAELARVTISAGEEVRKIRDELGAIPGGSVGEGWPLLRGFEPHWYQRDFVLDFPSNLKPRGIDAFIFGMVAGIGSGKTRCGAEKMGELVWRNRGLAHAVYAPTYRMLEDATKREFLECCGRKGIPFRHVPSQNMVELWGDSPVFFRSMENPDHLRGPNLAGVWIDEALQQSTREAFDVIAGRVRHPDAPDRCIVITGTPDLNNAFNWAYDVLVKDAVKNKARLYHGKTKDNSALPADFYTTILGLYDEKVARLELDGEWIDVARGRAYYNFTRMTHVLPREKTRYNSELPLILMVDFNVHPMHWVVGQSYPHNGDEVTYCIDEIYLDTGSTEEAALEFVTRYGKHRAGIEIYGDAAGRHRHTSATRTDYDIIDQTLEEKKILGVDKRVGLSNPLHVERIKDVNARFKDARGKIHLFVSEACEHLLEDFTRQGLIPGTMQLDKENKLVGHGSDAVGYYVNRTHAIRRMQVKTH
jgi:hypothetical protein